MINSENDLKAVEELLQTELKKLAAANYSVSDTGTNWEITTNTNNNSRTISIPKITSIANYTNSLNSK